MPPDAPFTVEALAAAPDRLDALAALDVLDTPPEPGFDGIVQLATALCDAPVALVSLVAADRQWFKARVGFPHCETDLARSVCVHALAEPDLLVIPDLAADPRTAANPLVTGEPHLRFYAGAPLHAASGQVLGTLCVMDHRPRPGGLTEGQRANLRYLAAQVVDQLALRRAVADRDALLAEQAAGERQRGIYDDTLRAIGAAGGDLDRILDRLVDGAMRAMPKAEGAAFELVDGGELEYRAARGSVAGSEGIRIPLDGSLAGACVRERQALLVHDSLADPRADRGTVVRLNVRAAVFAPVTRGEAVVGVLKLQAGTPGAFGPTDLRLAQLFAGAASAGLTEVRETVAQRAVEASEARYRAVFDSAVDYAIVVMDLRGRVTNWNKGAERILGWTAAEMGGEPADVFFTAEDRAAQVPSREMKDALAIGRGTDERWHLRKGGERFWANGEMMALRDGSGAAIGFVKILRDRTEQHGTLERLRDSERQLTLERGLLQGILQKAPIGISIAFADGGATFNDRLKRMLGHGPATGEARYSTYYAEHADGRPYAVMEYPTMRALRGGEVVEAELMRYRHAETREVRRWHLTSTPIRDGAGEIVAAVTVIADVEDQLRANEALQASEERLTLALGASGLIGWFDWDVPTDRLYSGASFARMYGVDPAEAAAGAPIAAFLGGIHPDDRERIGAEIARSMAGDGSYDAEYRLLAADGTVTWVHALGRVAFDDVGRPQRFSGIASDITAPRRAGQRQQALIDLGEALRDAGTVPAVTRAAAAIVGRTLGVSRAGFGLLDEALEHVEVEPDWTAEGVASIAGRHRFDDYGDLRPTLRRGEVLVIDDVRTDARTSADPRRMLDAGIAALVNVPVRERGRITSMFIVHDAAARRWSADELAFLRTVADRVEAGVARVRAEEQQQLLNAEIGHRLKNTLALVQAIVVQTLRNTADPAEARGALTARLMALAKAHDALTGGVRDRTTLRRVVEEALGLHHEASSARIVLDGPDVPVAARVALPLALMVHELATNAAKYGALCVAAGHVTVDWEIDRAEGAPSVRLRWHETDGPPVAAPSRKGFGSRLIERGLAGAVGGTVAVDYDPAGLRCTLVAPLSGFATDG